jgi:hypothetical protein
MRALVAAAVLMVTAPALADDHMKGVVKGESTQNAF